MLKFFNKRLYNLNDVFEHEVHENEVEDREDPTIQTKLKVNVFILILFFLSLGLLLFSLWYAFGKAKSYVFVRTISSGELDIVHSKADFGLTIDSFLNYNSYDNAIGYKFEVNNNNEHEINYRIKITEQNLSSKESINNNYLKYILLKNGDIIQNGNIKDLNNGLFNSTRTNSNSKDKYELKLWSNEPIDKGYKYIIEVVD